MLYTCLFSSCFCAHFCFVRVLVCRASLRAGEQMERNRKQRSGSSSRRDVSGVLVFIGVFLLASLVTLVWNYEGMQGLLRLMSREGMTGDGSGAAENAARREEVATGIVTSVAAAAGARVQDNEKEKEGTDATTGGGVAANRLSSSSGAVQLEPLVVDLTILTKAVDTGAGTGNL